MKRAFVYALAAILYLCGNAFADGLSGVSSPRVDWIDAKAYGAYGDSRTVSDATITTGSGVVTSATAAFTAGDVGKFVFILDGAVNLRLSGTITAVNSATSITTTGTSTANITGAALLYWGHDDTNGLRAATAAAMATTPQGRVWVPSGQYMLTKLPFDLTYSALTEAPAIIGDGASNTKFWVSPTYDFTSTTSGQSILVRGVNTWRARIGEFSVDLLNYNFAGSGYSVLKLFSQSFYNDVRILNVKGFTSAVTVNGATGAVSVRGFHIETGGAGVIGVDIFASGVAFYDTYVGNFSGWNLHVQNVLDSQNLGYYMRWFGGEIDEGGSDSVMVENSDGAVSFVGTKIFGGNNTYGIRVDATSRADVTNTQVEPFGLAQNRSGIIVAAGGTVSLSQTRLGKTGTGQSLNNSGTVYDLGGNTIPDITGTLPIQLVSSLPAALTVAGLKTCAAAIKYSRNFVTDANATTFNSVVAGGGTNVVPVFCDGTSWRIGG